MVQCIAETSVAARRQAHEAYAQFLLDRARRTLRARVGDPRTEEVYSAWIRRFLDFAAPQCAGDLDDLAAGPFLERLALVENVSPTALKRARRALMFLEIVVLGRLTALSAARPGIP